MMRKIKLKEAVLYSNKRNNSKELKIETFITTDNILPNKLGIKLATGLPPNGNSFPAYCANDILVSNIRPYLKKIWFSNTNGICSSDVLNFTAKLGFSAKFIYYNLHQDTFFEHMMNGAKGTKMPRGDKNQILDFEIPDFPLTIQKKIANTLTDIDNKIELNNRINDNLEQMAKVLYDYWFVQFDFPDKNGKPYKSGGGKIVWNDVLKRGIPEGWESRKLIDVANITMGQSPNGESYNEVQKGMIFFQGSTDFGWRYPENRVYTTAPTRYAIKDDVLLSVRAPIGTMNLAMYDCCIGRGLAALNSKDNFCSFLIYQMNYFKKKFDYLNSVGTTFGSLTKDDLYNLELAYPEKDILQLFESKVSCFDEKIKNNTKQNQQLSSLRDWLLPMLMNGQVDVK